MAMGTARVVMASSYITFDITQPYGNHSFFNTTGIKIQEFYRWTSVQFVNKNRSSSSNSVFISESNVHNYSSWRDSKQAVHDCVTWKWPLSLLWTLRLLATEFVKNKEVLFQDDDADFINFASGALEKLAAITDAYLRWVGEFVGFFLNPFCLSFTRRSSRP